MDKPQIYYVNGTAAAIDGQHVFKDAISKCGLSISELQEYAEVKELLVDEEGVYCLQDEGSGIDYGEKTLISSGGISAKGSGKNGSIGAIDSPKRSFQYYQEGIQGIKDLLEIEFNERKLESTLLRLLFIGVCGEMEGYLHSTLIALIQGCRDVFITLREYKRFPSKCDDEIAVSTYSE